MCSRSVARPIILASRNPFSPDGQKALTEKVVAQGHYSFGFYEPSDFLSDDKKRGCKFFRLRLEIAKDTGSNPVGSIISFLSFIDELGFEP